jgi:hypothetical protein
MSVILQGSIPLLAQPPPDQPVNFEPSPALAVRVTAVPSGNSSEQSGPQFIPTGELVTVPDPEPFFVTLTGTILTQYHGSIMHIGPSITLLPPPPAGSEATLDEGTDSRAIQTKNARQTICDRKWLI